MNSELEEITLRVDKETANYFNNSSIKEKSAIQAYFEMSILRYRENKSKKLFNTIDKAQRQAKKNGLNQEKLEELLNE
jgi:hypothetical protein